MKNQKGITLIELLLSLLIASMVIAGAYQVSINLAKSYVIQEQVAEAQNSVRAGMEIMAADLRMAGYDKEGGGSSVAVNSPVSGASNSVRVEWERDNNTIKSVQYVLSNRQSRGTFLNGILTDSPRDLDEVPYELAYMSGKVREGRCGLAVNNRYFLFNYFQEREIRGSK
jgi:prepilin-type N-terminal cleavage/methylation domain-containing protein